VRLEAGFSAAKRGPGKEDQTGTHYGIIQAGGLVLDLNLCLAARDRPRLYLMANSAPKNAAGRRLLTSKKVERASRGAPPGDKAPEPGFQVSRPIPRAGLAG
jgi:hypothetical protein